MSSPFRKFLLEGNEIVEALHYRGFLPGFQTPEIAKQIVTESEIEKATKWYQEFHGLKVDGVFGSVTSRSILDLRICGHPDVMSLESQEVSRNRWPMKGIRWTLLNPEDWQEMNEREVREAFDWAWKQWSLVCDIQPEYTREPSEAHVLIGHAKIDRAGGTLAWSQLANGTTSPKQQRYDSMEHWVFSANPPRNQIDLGRVAAHEIGHVLGIPHISSGNLLQPLYDLNIRAPQSGDIREAVGRYGRPTVVPDPDPDKPDPEKPCPDGGHDVKKWIIEISGDGLVVNSRAA